MIINFYEVLYIKLYQWSEKNNGKDYANNYSASLMITLIIFIVLTIFVMLLYLFTGWSFTASTAKKLAVIFSMVFVAGVNYLYFTQDDRYLKLLARGRSKRER